MLVMHFLILVGVFSRVSGSPEETNMNVCIELSTADGPYIKAKLS